MSFGARNFYTNWIYQLDKINNQMKTIRKVQNTCVMLNYYNKMEQDNYLGYIVSSQEYSGKYRYTIYFPSIQKIQNYSSRKLLKLYSNETEKFIELLSKKFSNPPIIKKKHEVKKTKLILSRNNF